MQATSKTHVYGLDHLRAFAAFLVFYWHGIHQRGFNPNYVPARSWFSIFEEGHVGVALFICITGFIFTVLTHDKGIHYLPFLKNRFLRIFPLLFLVTLYAGFALKPDATAIGVFALLLGGGTVWGTWSLVIEWQFYLCYPFIRHGIVKDTFWRTVAAMVLLIALFMFLRTYIWFVKPPLLQKMAYSSMFGRADQFILGIGAGLLYLKYRHDPRRLMTGVAVVVLTIAVVGALVFYHHFNATGGFYNRAKGAADWIYIPTVDAVIWSAVIWSYCILTRAWGGRIARWLAYLGTISYSTYMLHFISLPFASKVEEQFFGPLVLPGNDLLRQTVTLLVWHYPLTIVISAISYELIEKSFLRTRSPYTYKMSVPDPHRSGQA